MKVDAIIFDKDGTLIDFDSFWVTVSIRALNDILEELGITDIPISKFLTAFGVHNGVTDIESVLCRGTYEQMGQIMCKILDEYGCNIACDEMIKLVISAYNRNADAGEIKPSCPNLVEVLTALKKQNKKLAVVTTDNEEITLKCLKRLGVETLFDKIYTDDGKMPTKVDPYCANDFSDYTGVKKEHMVIVGDTMTDMIFAKNAGVAAIGVAKNEQNEQILKPHADVVISDLSKLLNILQ